ncbi:hypothetical protein [Phormidium nigroviride]
MVQFDLESAIASLNSGEPVIPLWLDRINLDLSKKVESKKEGY